MGKRRHVLVVDECRRTGSPSEEIIARLGELGSGARVSRVTGDDTYIPLGPAANAVLVSEADIVAAALALTSGAQQAAE